ncbi:hypothetical protein ACJA3G_36520, partial [Streptomyces sp. YS-3]
MEMRSKKHRGSLAAGLLTGALLLPWGAVAHAADPTPGSDQGGSPGPSAPAGLQISTELPKEIRVAHSSGKTALTAKILNKGTKDTGRITLTVLGLDGMRITGVDGCATVPENKLPKGTNTGFACAIDSLGAGADKSFTVEATYDLNRTGKICLPVTEGTEGTEGTGAQAVDGAGESGVRSFRQFVLGYGGASVDTGDPHTVQTEDGEGDAAGVLGALVENLRGERGLP